MTQDLFTSGRVTLTSQEIGEAVLAKLKTQLSREELSQAISDWLKVKHNFKCKKVVYLDKKEITNGIVAEVEQTLQDAKITKFPDLKEKRTHEMPKFSKRNVGVFKTIREILAEVVSQGKKEISFNELFDEIKKDFPMMDRKKLDIYIRDERQFDNILYDSKTKTILLA